MSTYSETRPKYDHNLITQAAKPIAVVLEEHVSRYGDNTLNTAGAFFKNRQPRHVTPKAKVHNIDTAQKQFEDDQAEERRMWQEHVANCTDEYAPNLGVARIHKAGSSTSVQGGNPNDIRLGPTMQFHSAIPELVKYPWLRDVERKPWPAMIKIREQLPMMVEAGQRIHEAYVRDHREWVHPKTAAKEALANPKVNDQPLSTTIPMYSTTPCPGLGPDNIDKLGLIKEDVGLKEPIITRDYPSPKDDKVRYGGAPISAEQATRVREKIQMQKWNVAKTTEVVPIGAHSPHPSTSIQKAKVLARESRTETTRHT